MRALKIAANDRRWFIPKVTEDKHPSSEYWTKFNEWLLEGGLQKIKFWAHEFLESNRPVFHGEEAPDTAAKIEMIQEGYSPGQEFAANLFDMVKQVKDGGHFIIADKDVIEIIKQRFHNGVATDKLERPLTIRRVAKDKGLYISKKDARLKDWGTLETRPHLICSSDALTDLEAPGSLGPCATRSKQVS
jgi:hypothetical protein